jgi:hypothetical protein
MGEMVRRLSLLYVEVTAGAWNSGQEGPKVFCTMLLYHVCSAFAFASNYQKNMCGNKYLRARKFYYIVK